MGVKYSEKGFSERFEGRMHAYPACDFAGVKRSRRDVGGVVLGVEEEGEGVALVVVHGGPGMDHRGFHPHLSRLAAERRVIYYDLRGHGMSSEPEDGSYGVAHDARDLDALRQSLGAGPVAVLGYSYGGLVAARAAFDNPAAFSHLVLCSSPIGLTPGEMERAGADHPLVPEIEAAPTPAARRELLYRYYFHKPLDAESRRWQEACENILETPKHRRVLAGYEDDAGWPLPAPPGEIPAFPVPTLFTLGRHDPITAAALVAPRVAASGRARCEVFEDSAHDPFVDEPASFTSKVLAFLRG